MNIIDALYSPLVSRKKLFNKGWGNFNKLSKIEIIKSKNLDSISTPNISWYNEKN